MTDQAASDLAKKRWDKTSKAERSKVAKELNAARWAGHVPKKKVGKKKAGKK